MKGSNEMKKKTIKIEKCGGCWLLNKVNGSLEWCPYYETYIDVYKLSKPKPTFCKVDKIIVCEMERK